jgi:anti-sigma regulatory factor (Ser/Thr protein kinase)
LLESNIADGRLCLRIEGSVPGLEAGQRELSAFLRGAGVDARGLYHAELAYEELVTNVIKYAFQGAPGAERTIDVHASIASDEIALGIEDGGIAFNVLEAAEPQPAASLEAATVGGRGLSLVRKVATRFEYQRLGNRNLVWVAVRRQPVIGLNSGSGMLAP